MLFTYLCYSLIDIFFFSSRRRHTRCSRDWSSDVCSSDLDGDSEWVADGARPVASVSTDRFELLRALTGRRSASQLRSEEHTSELQSRLHLVCRLLLGKKKTKTQI